MGKHRDAEQNEDQEKNTQRECTGLHGSFSSLLLGKSVRLFGPLLLFKVPGLPGSAAP
jgi:hypothetical protein